MLLMLPPLLLLLLLRLLPLLLLFLRSATPTCPMPPTTATTCPPHRLLLLPLLLSKQLPLPLWLHQPLLTEPTLSSTLRTTLDNTTMALPTPHRPSRRSRLPMGSPGEATATLTPMELSKL